MVKSRKMCTEKSAEKTKKYSCSNTIGGTLFMNHPVEKVLSSFDNMNQFKLIFSEIFGVL